MSYDCYGRVLVVDDEGDNRKILKHQLAQANYEVVLACNGKEGWEILKEDVGKINLVLLDRMMPEMDGIQLLKLMKENRIDDIPVIMQTAAAEKKQLMELINQELDVFYYLIKPYSRGKLLTVVDKALGIERDDRHTHAFL